MFTTILDTSDTTNIALSTINTHYVSDVNNVSLVVSILYKLIDNIWYDDIVLALKTRFTRLNSKIYIDDNTYKSYLDINQINEYVNSIDTSLLVDKTLDQLLSTVGIDEFPTTLINNITNTIKYRLVAHTSSSYSTNNIFLLTSNDVNNNGTLNAFSNIGQTTFYLPKNKPWSLPIIKTWLSKFPYSDMVYGTNNNKVKPMLNDWIALFTITDYMDNKHEFDVLTNNLLDSGKYLIVDMLPKHLRSKAFLYANWTQVPDDLKFNVDFFKLWKLYNPQSPNIKFISPYI